MYIKPFLPKEWSLNPFNTDERNLPVNFLHPFKYTYICNFEIPDGYMINEIPANVNVKIPESGGYFRYNTACHENIIQIVSLIEITQVEFPTIEYQYLKEFYNRIVNKFNE